MGYYDPDEEMIREAIRKRRLNCKHGCHAQELPYWMKHCPECDCPNPLYRPTYLRMPIYDPIEQWAEVYFEVEAPVLSPRTGNVHRSPP